MKIFLRVIAWIGVLIVVISVPLTCSCGGSKVGMYGMCLFFSSMICAVGVFLLLLGGLLSREKVLWILAIIGGIAYLAVLPRTWIPHETLYGSVGWLEWKECLLSALPGLICIAGGIAMKILDKRRKVSH